MMQKSVQPAGGDVAESCGQGVLKPGTSDKESFAMQFGKLDQGDDDGIQIFFDQTQSGAQLENQSGIECVLAGSAVMHVTQGIGRVARDNCIELFKKRDGKIAGGGHRLRESR